MNGGTRKKKEPMRVDKDLRLVALPGGFVSRASSNCGPYEDEKEVSEKSPRGI
jgi:hypothetical protein